MTQPNQTSAAKFSAGAKAIVKVMLVASALLLLPAGILLGHDDDSPFLPNPVRSVSTVPTNGDLNPYGVAFVPRGFPAGAATRGNILVSNFNDSGNVQGTGTTIVDIPPNGPATVFFQGPSGLGLTTALNILRKGFVLVGNFPAAGPLNCPAPPGTAGSILVIDNNGKQAGTIANSLINGPWDSALFDGGESAKLFVSNALTGTVVRLDLSVTASGVTVNGTTQIASGYGHQCDSVTFVDAPTGLVYDAERDVLYVASTVDNAIFAIGDAGDTTKDRGMGRLVYSDAVHLHGPLGMAQAPNGHLVVSNNDAINADPNQPSELVEFTKAGQFVKQISLDPSTGGSFGLAIQSSGDRAKLAAVDDNQNILLIWSLQLP